MHTAITDVWSLNNEQLQEHNHEMETKGKTESYMQTQLAPFILNFQNNLQDHDQLANK
jgi:hypothetical protein